MLKQKVAVVTGGGRGIGKAVSIELAKNGADIALIYVGNYLSANDTIDEIKSYGVNAKAYKCDVSSFNDTKNIITEIINDFGKVDILLNNAGITKDGLMLNMTEQAYDDVIDTNLKGAFNMIRHLYSHFMKKRYGRIINITSVAGIIGNAGQTNYSSAKAGMIGLTKSVAKELASRNVTCNAIAPGFIKTDMTGTLPAAVIEKAIETIPLKKMGEPEDIAKMAVYLASDNAQYITGEVIKIDGGLTM